jgi:hypothetical protein
VLARLSLLLLLAPLISGCGSSSEGSDKTTAPEYAATPRKALESWVTAVRAGDTEMVCRLLIPRTACATPGKEAFIETKFLPHVRAEMRGLNGELHYGGIGLGSPALIGVVSGESPTAYAVRVIRGKTQWWISQESYAPGLVPRIILNHPDPAAVLASGRTPISFTAWAYTPGSVYPNAALWIDSRHLDGRLAIGPEKGFELERVRWIGAAQLLPGRHVMVAAVRSGDGALPANAWILTVR